jgi:O-antigen/teichoic acid export membrane protein
VPNVRRALALSFLQNYATTLIQFVASLFIARLLTPAEFGVFSVAMVLVAVAQVLRDFGVADYIAQERDLTVEKIRAAATLAIITGFGLAAILLAAAWSASLCFRRRVISTARGRGWGRR